MWQKDRNSGPEEKSRTAKSHTRGALPSLSLVQLTFRLHERTCTRRTAPRFARYVLKHLSPLEEMSGIDHLSSSSIVWVHNTLVFVELDKAAVPNSPAADRRWPETVGERRASE